MGDVAVVDRLGDTKTKSAEATLCTRNLSLYLGSRYLLAHASLEFLVAYECCNDDITLIRREMM